MSPPDTAAPAARDNPASRERSTSSSSNVFDDMCMPNPGIELRLADARIAGLPKTIAIALAELVGIAIASADEHDPRLAPALDGAIAAISRVVLPAEITPVIEEVLGLPNFKTGPTAHLFRAAGTEIKAHFEEEQAYVLFRFLHLALQHGEGWAREADRLVDEARAVVKAKKAAAEAGAEPQP